MMFQGKYGLIVAGLAVAALCMAGDSEPRTTQKDLVGAWRLVSIEVDGRELDPFYHGQSRGLLIFDASGWFSVQIEGTHRPDMQVPAERPANDQSEATTRLKAAVLDSYYAYYGTWSFDPETSTVTHHAKGALYPSEGEATYQQHVEVVGRRMVFSRMQNIAGHSTVQTKRWERVSGGGG
jgi:Lipocalin-like domain